MSDKANCLLHISLRQLRVRLRRELQSKVLDGHFLVLELKQRKQLLVEVLKVVFRLAHFAQDVQKFRARVLHCHAQDLVVYREVLEKLNLVASLVVDYKQPADTDFVRDVIFVFRVELEVRIDHKLVRNYCCEVERRATLLKVERSRRAHHQRLLLQIEHAFKVH